MKTRLGINVLEAAKQRISTCFDVFERIYVSFSGGKDSSVMLHLVYEEAKRRNQRFGVLFVDLEAQYKLTIQHILETLESMKDLVDVYWVSLPIILRNAVSVYEPRWKCWDPDSKPIWVREAPDFAITDKNYFDFFQTGMEFEEFVPEFHNWYSQGKLTCCFVGIRCDESLNRYRTIANRKKVKLFDYKWTTKVGDGPFLFNAYPIYDWNTQDIWVFNSKGYSYNRLYDLMHQAGLTIHQQRICQPYGDDQRKGLWLYHVIEPETWAKVVARVSGANSGSEFVQYSGSISGTIKISKPDGHTWKSFSELILNSMPELMAEHYRNKIFKFIRFYETHGNYRNGIPDEADPKDEAGKKAPSWRRVAKMLLRNDYWGKGLSFTQQKHGLPYQKYLERVKRERQEYKNRRSGHGRY